MTALEKSPPKCRICGMEITESDEVIREKPDTVYCQDCAEEHIPFARADDDN